MKEYREVLKVPSVYVDLFYDACNWKDGDPWERRLDEDETFAFTAKFPDGYEMDVKCCGVQYESGSSNSAWCEAVLFNSRGGEVACTDVEDEFLGDWELEHDGVRYVVDVLEEV